MLSVCPKCDISLIVLNLRGIELDFCDRCRGLWLDTGELENLLAMAGEVPDHALLDLLGQSGTLPRGRKHLCPRCDEPLRQIDVKIKTGQEDPLIIERCPHGDGLWCDAGELQRLLTMTPTVGRAGKVVDYLNELFGARGKGGTNNSP
jgi:Zn-finger nucleic acid-binding protein